MIEMNGQTSPSAEEQKVISDEQNIKYSEKKKMSLTLPLLNVVLTNTVSDDDDTSILSEKELKDSANLDVANASSKKKKIYESDDTFIQTIFSQTIKSTTATPTEDEPAPDFVDFKKSSTSSQIPTEAIETTENLAEITQPKSDQIDNDVELSSQEPAAVYTYFHQTIEEDDSPDSIDATNECTASNPVNTLTTSISTQNANKTQTIICTEFKEELFSEQDRSNDNSLNNTSTACASNETISEPEHSLTQLNSFESDVSVHPLTK